MKDCKLCTNTTTACNGKKEKIVNRKNEEKKRRSQDKPYFVKSAWVSLTSHNFVYIWNNNTEISLHEL